MIKTYQKRIGAVLCLLGMLLGLFACTGKGTGDQNTGTDSVPATSDEPPKEDDTVWLFKNGKTRFCVIYPADPADAVFSAARSLQTAFETYAGTRIEIYEEGTDIPADPASTGLEILLGMTQRNATAETVAEMEDPGGYSVAVRGSQLVLCGKTASQTENAAEYFIRTYLKTPAAKEPDQKLSALALSAVENYHRVRSGILFSAKIGGVELEQFRLVVPHNGYAEKYVAELFSDYLFTYYGGKTPSVVSDIATATGHEILIGKTNRTTLQTGEGSYRVAVTETGMQAVCGHVTGYIDLYDALRKAVPSSASSVVLNAGDEWSGEISGFAPAKSADITLMFHNVLGYLKAYPAANRPELMLQLYRAYQPDIIGMQECGAAYFRSGAKTLMDGLKKAGYEEIVFTAQNGTGNPVFYHTQKLNLIASGYDTARKGGDKGTTWAVFSEKSNPESVFAVTNSHFAANSNAGGDATLGNTYRVQDAATLLRVVEQIKADYPGIPVIAGGDFNTYTDRDPVRNLVAGGLIHANDFAEVSPDYAAHIGYPTYDSEYDRYLPRTFVWKNAASALDHVMFGGNTDAITVPEYAILKDRLSCVVSDHLPQLVYVNWKA